ncbi:hypothetical protein ACFWNU_30495, partial [Streptomyces sp. NPDC058427]
MAARYQHLTGGILADVAQWVGGLIRGGPTTLTTAALRAPKSLVETADETTYVEGPRCKQRG